MRIPKQERAEFAEYEKSDLHPTYIHERLPRCTVVSGNFKITPRLFTAVLN